MELNKGQALLIVLLSMAVVLTVVLSILSRSITDIAITSREQEALRAFSAAEAGVEEALLSGGTGIFQSNVGDSSNFTAQVSSIGEGAQSFVYPKEVVSGDSVTVWFVAHDDNGNIVCSSGQPCFTGSTLEVCWGKPQTSNSTPNTPALEASVTYLDTPGNLTSAQIARSAVDPNVSRRQTNSFTADDGAGCTVDGQQFQFRTQIDLSSLNISPLVLSTQNGLQFIRLKTLYNSDPQPIALNVNFPGNTLLPSQGLKIDSTGTTADATRKVEVYRLFSEMPAIFDSVIFSPSGITK